MTKYSIADAISAGLNVEPIGLLRSFTETDPQLSFHQIPIYFEHIKQSLKWQSTNIISENFLSNELCYFIEDARPRIIFCVDPNNSSTPQGRFIYIVSSINEIGLAGPEYIRESEMKKQFETDGFLLWEAYSYEIMFKNYKLKYGTFRKFYPNHNLKLFRDDDLLCCEYNTSKGIKYLKLLHNSYVGRLSKTFDALPIVLLNIISSYVLGELLMGITKI
ncbi:MAG: hypothetical protein Hyperionvirus16_32 [Hyperionvirus sp.]|uniref:Uncharacterized protein n=1 Tax=Hyperionvirus sp. TaxID=2487770 RepID=A0A3G5A9W7_9VIRU|nr:MAG: hypothetical protein Hyperionvirus16_32 [Hyperionvirus sp.]